MNQILETLYALRTIHGDFSERDVSDGDLQTVVDACVRAANSSARQPYSIIVVKDRCVVKEQFAYGGSKALLFCVDFNRIVASAEHVGRKYAVNGIIDFITCSTDTILAAQTAAIAAKSLGIDSMFTNSIHRRDISGLYDYFGLPRRYCFPLIALLLGYPAKEPAYLKGRFTGSGLVHDGRYRMPDAAGLDELVRQYDDPGRHLGLIGDWGRKGFSHYLEWFFDVWCGGEKTEKNDERNIEKHKEFYSVLQQAGFIEPELIG